MVVSLLDYHAWECSLDGRQVVSPHGAGMVDDIASFILPGRFREFVLPCWEQRFAALTTGTRSAHVENLTPEHLPYLEEIGLSSFDPSISPRLNPQLITAHCRCPSSGGWRPSTCGR